eukprot:CAMPEP_0178439434 /NCGR_PEP_ID=MMETSP0689_2-20121128/36153_1 /TAXON_ID=160604 /ORGANISM="Amphidinium massartii, Strain CS-259" /LENGTH=118 /DNA_ID=CAMNT_0020061961 /DNA_START=183 /DNA_END=542 /DNA_ORIENTATION=-
MFGMGTVQAEQLCQTPTSGPEMAAVKQRLQQSTRICWCEKIPAPLLLRLTLQSLQTWHPTATAHCRFQHETPGAAVMANHLQAWLILKRSWIASHSLWVPRWQQQMHPCSPQLWRCHN